MKRARDATLREPSAEGQSAYAQIMRANAKRQSNQGPGWSRPNYEDAYAKAMRESLEDDMTMTFAKDDEEEGEDSWRDDAGEVEKTAEAKTGQGKGPNPDPRESSTYKRAKDKRLAKDSRTVRLNPSAFHYGKGVALALDVADPEFRPVSGGKEKVWRVTVRYKGSDGRVNTNTTLQGAPSKIAAESQAQMAWGSRLQDVDVQPAS